ncbi:MAG: hypothetical protein JJ939_11995 [Alphaproteobacteria bacterium]|nr:hypothetical protein [Alphaproteobacteria bacterium]MBO6629134.1 hypothetical protein [Alphaproteobacteria bacterium]
MIDQQTQHEIIKHGIDAGAVSVTLGSLFGYLPEFAALATLIWTCIRIYETQTVQRWLGRRGEKK